jgi:hypothetical protein
LVQIELIPHARLPTVFRASRQARNYRNRRASRRRLLQASLIYLRFEYSHQNESVIRLSPPVAGTAPSALRQLGTRRPYIPMAAVESIATVLVMDVSTFTRPGVTRWLRQLRSFTREESLATVILRRLVTASTRLDADGVIGIGDMVEQHRATGQLHGRLDALAMPPGQQVELHRRASSVNCASNLSLAPPSPRVQVSSVCCSRCAAKKNQVAAKKTATQMT